MLLLGVLALFCVVSPVTALSDYERAYAEALRDIDFDEVKKDILATLTDSKDFWPADYGNYGPFMVRQAWHCSGSYRISDGRGGCAGGRQRFEPERSWADNTNLDKAKLLLWPIKQKYGLGLSWGDLMILTGNTAIESMGGPVLGFCAGRIDNLDGAESELLGPSAAQEARLPCPVNGKCKSPLGTTTVGLIYLNPEGPMGQPIPSQSAYDVRDAFGRMNMDDEETVALIGGGHAFGKTHGACPAGPGPSPKQDPSNPWPGKCGSGRGKDTFTSGFEGAWTLNPTRWDNAYYQELIKNKWDVHVGPGGHHQWKIANDNTNKVMMLTSDISLLNDPQGKYQAFVHRFATNITALNDVFSRTWYKLTTRDMGPVTRCVGPWVPPPQPFQYPLPAPKLPLPDFSMVSRLVMAAARNLSASLQPDYYQGKPYYGAVFVHLAYQCSSTFRFTDYLGGCNGARIRFSPQTEYPSNVAMDKAMGLLRTIQVQVRNLSWADLIVLAGTTVISQFSGEEVPFCGGRVDATDGSGSELLSPNTNYSASIDDLKETATLLNLGLPQFVALSARPRSAAQMERMGYYGSWTADPTLLSNEYFKTLLSEEWTPMTLSNGNVQYKATGKEVYMTASDLALKWDPELLAIAQSFAEDGEMFTETFGQAWTGLMNADRFDGPVGNLCD